MPAWIYEAKSAIIPCGRKMPLRQGVFANEYTESAYIDAPVSDPRVLRPVPKGNVRQRAAGIPAGQLYGFSGRVSGAQVEPDYEFRQAGRPDCR